MSQDGTSARINQQHGLAKYLRWSSSDDKSAERSVGLLHTTTTPTTWRGGAQILKQEQEDVFLLDRREAKREE